MILKDVQTDAAIAVDVGVIDACGEVDLHSHQMRTENTPQIQVSGPTFRSVMDEEFSSKK